MATPCANCVYRGTSWCGIFCGRSNLGRDVEKAPGDKRIRPVFVGGGESGLEDLRWNPRLFSLVVALLLFFAVSSWCACTQQSGSVNAWPANPPTTYSCRCEGVSIVSWADHYSQASGIISGVGEGCSRVAIVSYSPTEVVTERVTFTCTWAECDTQAEADSLYCELNPDDPSCTPQVDSTACDSYRQECEQYGGKFTGNVVTTDVSETGCLSFCDMCTSKGQENYRRAIAVTCCLKGKAPPEAVTSCLNNEASGDPNMSFSNFDCDNRGGFDCDCEDVNSDNVSTYHSICEEGNWPDSSAGGGSGGESSSSEGDSAASPYPEGCLECPWLDSILDTLKLEKKNTDQIVTCILTPGLCPGLFSDDSSDAPFQFDTTWLKYIRPFLDTTLRLDSAQLRAILKLDTNELKRLLLDSAQLDNDSATRQVISGGIATLDSTTDALNDTTRKWFRRIADSIGVSTDSLAAHLDSILRHIPDSVLDSIVKYQQYATDNFDSILYGTGKGFALVDSLIDSAVHYFKLSNHYDSVYRVMFSEYDSSFNANMGDLPARNASAIGAALGYGDTASTNLRGDLEGIRQAIEGLGDSIGGFGGGFDTAMYGGNYGARSVDTSYGSYINTMSNRYANLARNASGGTWGDTATLETVFRTTYEDTVGNTPQGQDSIAEAQYSYLADSAELMLARAKDSLMQDTSLLRSYYDTLKTEMQIWNWDSVLIGPIRDAIPDNNSCPEDCFKGQFALPGTGDIAYDFGLCRRWPILMDQDVFMFIRILLRLITAVSCIYIGMWTIAGRKD